MYGFLALVSIIFAVAIPFIFRINKNKTTAYLLANRRWIGIYTFVFALIHVLIVMHFFFAWNIAEAMENPYRLMGGISIIILAAMTATSNDTAMRKLGRNWKRLHTLIYVVLILLLIHSFNIGSIFMRETWISTIVIIIGAVVVVLRIYSRLKKKPAISTQNDLKNEENK